MLSRVCGLSVLIAVVLCASSGFATSKTGRGVLEYLEDMGARNAVIVGSVTSVEPDTIVLGGSRKIALSRVSLQAEKVLFGAAESREIVHGINVFDRDESGEPRMMVQVDTPWLLVGDRVLVVVKDFDVAGVRGQSRRVRRVKDVLFLDVGVPLEEAVLYRRQSTINTEVWESVRANKAVDPYIAVDSVDQPVALTIQDIAEVLRKVSEVR